MKSSARQGLEGIIAKRVDSRYESGERSGAWLKFRVNKGQELVIGGYRVGKNYFENLAVGYYDDAGKLIFIAKIKNGFTPDVKKQVFERLRPLETKVCPFNNLPEPKTARRGEALTAEAIKNYRWVKPKLVAEVEFTNWTAADHLRDSRFVGLRDDKHAREVHEGSYANASAETFGRATVSLYSASTRVAFSQPEVIRQGRRTRLSALENSLQPALPKTW